MEKRNLQKINKAAVATVLAASGITISAPAVPTKASGFTDLNPEADNYKPILELYNRGYISGYKDGTFRPNQAVTRGQAAKMLAQALNLNMTNPKNPRFSDVPTSNGFYQYIAALAGAGIITGYSDQTFRPNEPITRNQMAKILTLGYKFQQSTKLTHDFRDVAESNPNRFYIQTLYDLGITKGTTQITYSPYGSVTRGQLATFIYRAENTTADAVKPVKEISSISGSSVYINGIAYRVDASLRDLINETNAPALKGAHIEGQIIGETLKSISSLTLNAEGNKNRILVLDGNYSTFTGELTIQGNYIRLKNWTITGQVKVTEAPRRTLSNLAGPLSNLRVASLSGFGFIDWSKPTDTTEEDDDPSYNDGGHDLETKPPILPGGNVVEKMPVTEKFVDFTNCSISRLIIEANRTHIEAAKTIPQLTVRGWVRQFEVYANIDTLYIETDVATMMYGVGNINKIYKNSYKNVYLNSSGHANLLVVDNTGGKIDLGDNFYVDKVIIPPNKMPNDIFNDFIKDNDKIGDIEDPNGNDVDRDPIEDTIIPDWEEPAAQIVRVDVDGTNAKAQITSTEKGRYYFTVKRKDEKPPSIREILDDAKTTTLKTSGQGMIGADLKATFDIAGLVEMTDYTLYVVVSDEAGNYSDKVSKDFTTMDGTPPVIRNLKGEGMAGGTRAKITFQPSEPGVYKYMVVEEGLRAPSLAELLRQPENNVTMDDVLKGVEFIHTGLKAMTQYKVYMVMIDESGNQSTTTDEGINISAPFWTGGLDNIRPELAKTVLTDSDILDIGKEPTTVVLTFTEQVDKKTAEDVKNYTLSGTGNLKDHPYSATLSKDGLKVTLKIPSMAAFVNNDTLIIRVTNVEDVSGNKILDDGKGNLAVYTYQSITNPALSNLFVHDKVTDPTVPKELEGLLPTTGVSANKVTFAASHTGTYFYLILPANPGAEVKKPSVSQVVFPEDNYKDDQVFQGKLKLASGSGEAVEGNGKDLERGNAFNVYYDESKVEKTNGYYIYMVLRDRNGNYSNVEVQYFLPNKRDWELVNFEFAGAPNSTNVVTKTQFYYPEKYDVTDKNQKFEFNMKFNVEMNTDTVTNKSNYKLEGELAKYLQVERVEMTDSWNAKMTLGYRSDIKTEDLKVANTYIAYYMQHQDKGSITMKGLKSWATGELEKVTGEKVESNSKTVELEYTDRVKPMLLSQKAMRLNVNKVDGEQQPAQLELTFSEDIDAAKLNKDVFAGLTFSEGSSGITISSIVQGDMKNKIVITLSKGNLKHDEKVFIELKQPDTDSPITGYLVDGANNTIMVSSDELDPLKKRSNNAVYIYRDIKAIVQSIYLDHPDGPFPSNDGSGKHVYTSSRVGLVTDIVNISENSTLYYVVRSSLATAPGKLTDFIQPSMNNLVYGKKIISSPVEANGLDARETAGNPSATFINGAIFYMMIVDEYNNVSEISKGEIQLPLK